MDRSARIAILALVLAALAVLPAAGAEASSRPHLSWVRCWRSCHGSRTVEPRGWVKLAGRHVSPRMHAIFRVKRGGVHASHATRTKSKGRGRLIAQVPSNALSGRVYLKLPRGPRTNSAGPIRIQKPRPRYTGGTGSLSGTAFDGNGMWIWYVSKSSGGDPNAIAAQARAHGVSTVFVKSGDGTSYWTQFSPALVQALKAGGLHVCAWQYVYGSDPAGEASVAAQAKANGADCFVIDAESEYEGKYAQAQTYVQQLRSAVGPDYPIGLAGFPYVDYHASFPYSVFLGTGGAQFNLPQAYWKEIGGGVNAVMDHTYRFNRPYGRAIDPLGQVYDSPPASDITTFRQIAAAQGSAGVSWWDWQEGQPYAWDAVGAPLGPYSGPPPASDWAGIANGSKGDLVVWAQQHLEGAGEVVTVDGDYGAQTQQAVADFQAKTGLPVTGAIDTATWQALLRYAPAPVSWRRGAHAASAGGRTGPRTAALPATRYEIPLGLGRR